MLFFSTTSAHAQGDPEGRVVAGDSKAPVPGVQVQVPAAGRSAVTDSSGRFVLTGLPAGPQVVVLRALGFRPDSARVAIPYEQILVQDFTLKRATTTLGEVKVTGKAVSPRMATFDEHRRAGIGTFFDREELVKVEHRRMDAVIAAVPGTVISHAGMAAYARVNPFRGAGGMRNQPCDMDVYLDGLIVSAPGRFNINSLEVRDIEAIEAYVGTAQIPAMYNRTGNGCGVLVIWTRVSK